MAKRQQRPEIQGLSVAGRCVLEGRLGAIAATHDCALRHGAASPSGAPSPQEGPPPRRGECICPGRLFNRSARQTEPPVVNWSSSPPESPADQSPWLVGSRQSPPEEPRSPPPGIGNGNGEDG